MNFPERLANLWESEIKAVFESGKERRIEFQLNDDVWVDWVLVPEKDEIGNIIAVITSGRDISEIKELEQRTKIALQREKELNNLKTQFISTVAHEFKTPLTAVQSTVDLLLRYKEKINDYKRVEYLNRIIRSVNTLDDMVKELLTLSRFESGKIELKIQKLDIVALIEKIVQDHQNVLKKGQVIEKEYGSEKIEILSDKNALSMIINNLLNNASKYSDEDAVIAIEVRDNVDGIELEIKDEGKGITDEDKKHIFEPFYRACHTASIKGTGLGLSIVAEYVNLLKGVITVEDNEKKGTIFRIKLPKMDGAEI